MPVIMSYGKASVFALTSKPSKPKPAPDPKLIAKVVSCGDREITVTIPFPDTIELIAYVTNENVTVPDKSGKSVKAIYKALDDQIGTMLLEVAMATKGKFSPQVNTAGTLARWEIPYDPVQPLNRAHLTLWRQKGDDFGSWQVRLEFSPSKAKPDGIVQLIADVDEALQFLDPQRLAQSFVVGRVDAAIDCIGACPIDLIAHVPKPGKRMVYVGNAGLPETVYLYEAKPALKEPPKTLAYNTKGTHRLTLYERRDYHRQLKLEPPYGNCPFTRAEVSTRWKNNRPKLADLGSIKNQFKGRRVAYAANIEVANGNSWRQFCMAVFGAGIEAAQWGWFPGAGVNYAKFYDKCAGDLIDETCWDRWQDGIEATGLSAWIALANEP